jgi:nicotinamide phosphoribosyltransferase
MTLAQTDSYKLSHKGFMVDGTTKIYSNLTARSSKHLNVLKDRYDNKVVNFGLQYFIKNYLIEEWNNKFFSQPKEKVIGKFKRLIDAYLGVDAVSMEHFEALHDLGYLPIEIKALPEGARVNIKVPLLTIANTNPDYAWLTNYLETVMSCEVWKAITNATVIYEYRKLVNEYALKTTGSLDFTMFQLHDFSFRGMSGRYDAALSGAAFLLSSCGTDTIPAIELLEDYYNADVTKEFIATSVPASEHSLACSGTAFEGEFESYEKWITKDYPTGIVSLVSDTYDYWKVLTDYLPRLKDKILTRPANALGLSKVVIRPDSGNPADIICGLRVVTYKEAENYLNDSNYYNLESDFDVIENEGKYFKFDFDCLYSDLFSETYNHRLILKEEISEAEVKGSVELLWETFGGTITEQGYKVLDSHIGLIYGDSITPAVASDVFKRLEAKGFASTNIVFGIGSYTMNYNTRDSLGMAVKATYAEIDGKGYELFKDPITDSGMKKSAKGLLRVEKEGDDYVLYDQQTIEQEKQGELTTVFKDGELLVDHTLTEIRNRLWGQV